MSSYVDATTVSVDHCEVMATQFPDLAEPYYNKIASYCQQRLWHQLTVLILDFVENDVNTFRPLSVVMEGGDEDTNNNTFLALYDKVVLRVSKKINQLSLCQIAAAVAIRCVEAGSSSIQESKQLLQELLTKQESLPNHTATSVYLQSKIALLTLPGGTTTTSTSTSTSATTPPTKDEMDKIHTAMKTNAGLLNQLIPDTSEAMVVNAAHYEMSMRYYKIVGPPEAFYEEAIHYLNYYQPPSKSSTTAVDRKAHMLAVDLCLAALTGEGVYNLGQVVTNPILKALADTPDGWLVDLLQTCSRGDVRAFRTMCTQTYHTHIASQPALINMGHKMQEKVTLLGLIELVFAKPASDRTLEYTEIASGLDVPVEDVEWIIMRAFSVKLLEGTMDQVDGTVHITWILPRSLGNEQMADLAGRFGDWAQKVSTIKDRMQEETPAWTQ